MSSKKILTFNRCKSFIKIILFILEMLSNINDAILDFKSGKLIIVVDDESRENEGDIIFNTSFATPENINFCIQNAGGLICAAISQNIAEKLNLKPMQRINRDLFETAFYDSIDAHEKHGVSTGISASDRSVTAQLLGQNDVNENDFRKPGHLFTVVSKKYGTLERMGHTESAVDLSKICNLPESAIMCEIVAKDGTMMRRDGLEIFAKQHNLKIISVEQIKHYRIATENILIKSETAVLPTQFGIFNIVVYKNPITNIEHSVLFKKNNTNKPIVRLHSECLTGYIFSSLICDCNEQLNFAMKAIEKNDNGVLIYLKGHEGRGIGIFNKINAYKLQEQGLNTVEANLKLGLPNDSRDYSDAIMILKDLELDNFDLMTGNPEKVEFLKNFDFKYDIITAEVHLNKYNDKYLHDKEKIMHHILNLK